MKCSSETNNFFDLSVSNLWEYNLVDAPVICNCEENISQYLKNVLKCDSNTQRLLK